ncbi:fasciclin domain-containing protein [Pengzhenrongella phosphoraccumulans]|uniref:fasciclin domain-containing protein n=1 Tax=Pengzhenrongella phosphoraccumulans TaxID=3114394 RepID=UPI0038902307
MRRQISLVAVLALALATTAACSSTDTAETATTAATTVETPMETASPDAMMAKDIVDTAVAAGDFTTLATALTAAGLVDTLKGEGPFTVFAPTDEAFAALPAGTLDTLLADPTGDLTSILTYHVVPGKVMAADVLTLDGQEVKTVNGAPITVNVDGSTVSLTDAKGNTVNVTQTDIEASNGVIHVIDAVLMP